VNGSHTFTNAGDRVVGVTVTRIAQPSDYGKRQSNHKRSPAMTVQANDIYAISGVSFTGTVATFTVADPSATFVATVHWNDGTSSTGTVTADGEGGLQSRRDKSLLDER